LRDNVKTLIWYLSETHELPEPIIEIGSYQCIGQVGYADLRPFFKGKKYIGCDIQQGPGVNRIENVESLNFKDREIATCLFLDTIEHVGNPIKAMQEIYRCLNSDGILIMTSHMWFPIHLKPDYWRFTPSCFYAILLKEFPIKEIYTQGEPTFPHFVAGLACKNKEKSFQVDLVKLNSMLPYPLGFQKYTPEEKNA